LVIDNISVLTSLSNAVKKKMWLHSYIKNEINVNIDKVAIYSW